MRRVIVGIDCLKVTCGKCVHQETHPCLMEEAKCTLFDRWLEARSGEWKTGMSFNRCQPCLGAEKA